MTVAFYRFSWASEKELVWVRDILNMKIHGGLV